MRLSIAVIALVIGFSLAGCFEGPQGPQGKGRRDRLVHPDLKEKEASRVPLA